MSSDLIIGVLALQGAVDLHRPHIEGCGAEFRAVKTPAQFEEVDAFILPGGESTTMLKLIENFKLWDVLAEQFAKKPVWGICAGAILMAERSFRTDNLSSRPERSGVEGSGLIKPDPSTTALRASAQDDNEEEKSQKSFGLLPIQVRRNGYGTQLESHMAEIEGYTVSFIRAPVITAAGDCEVLASHNGDPVWVQKGRYMASTFHPELTLEFPSPMHRAFIEGIRRK